MKKGGLIPIGLTFLFVIFLLKSATAQFFNSYYGGGSYSSFSPVDIFSTLGGENIVFISLFLILFTFIYTILIRTGIFRDFRGQQNKGSSVVISICISLLSIYGIYRSGFDISSLFIQFGISPETLYTILGIFSIAIAIFLIWRFGFGLFLMLLGVLIGILVFFTDVIYEKNIALIIAAALFIIGFFLLRRIRHRILSNYSLQKEGRQWRGRTHVMILGVLGIVLGIAWGNNLPVIIVGAILTVIGFWLWHRNRPGLYRPLDFTTGHYPIQERRQFLNGGPLILIGLLVVGIGLALGMNVVMIIGGAIALLGFGLRLFR